MVQPFQEHYIEFWRLYPKSAEKSAKKIKITKATHIPHAQLNVAFLVNFFFTFKVALTYRLFSSKYVFQDRVGQPHLIIIPGSSPYLGRTL